MSYLVRISLFTLLFTVALGSSDSDEFDSDSEESEERDVAPEGRPNVYSTIPPLHAAKFMNTSVMRRRR
ncbi:hypothetical protein RB195_007762 [Necator americanus]|uniref:Uncharacterized protein n=1 Tax=Necator americanus TaxID=51031 RepID=A0ABR1C167_NECAM